MTFNLLCVESSIVLILYADDSFAQHLLSCMHLLQMLKEQEQQELNWTIIAFLFIARFAVVIVLSITIATEDVLLFDKSCLNITCFKRQPKSGLF